MKKKKLLNNVKLKNIKIVKVLNKLLKTIISTNLLLIQPLFNISNRFFFTKFRFNLLYLEPLEFIKTIKQLIRGFQVLQYQKNSTLYLESSTVNLELLVTLIKFNKLKFRFTPVEIVKKEKLKDMYVLYLYSRTLSFTSNYFENLFKKKFYLIFSMNSNFEKSNLGFYKIYSELEEFQKTIFLISLLKIFLTKKEKNRNKKETKLKKKSKNKNIKV